ncbi:hypothetical protein [Bradyrhizobium sp. Ai1a-2]|uniref:hypothetical protein n=1 Tax=Bradyrhizobium sp. Ai1a-2 TaxID=196490 RepID=UPI0004283145|nr:hypothetical protein [Bradyrhizobium sp. Ai1a-2]
MPIPGTPELRNGCSQDGWTAVTAYQICSSGPPSIVRGPGEHPTVGPDIRGVDKKRVCEVGQRRFFAFKLPVRLRAKNEAMGRWRRLNTAASIRVFERCDKVLSCQRLRRQALKRYM